jgi:hypothetical protein
MAPMDNRLLRPRASGLFLPSDADARAYVIAVNSADGQPLERPVAEAIDAFVQGCKADGIWSAIKTSCILMGARTLSGALTPLKGGVPTNVNNNFVSGDYDRKTGLVGNGTSKALNSGRNENSDPQDSNHMAVYASVAATSGNNVFPYYIGAEFPTAFGRLQNNGQLFFRNRTTNLLSINSASGFLGMSRSTSSAFTARVNATNSNSSLTSAAPGSQPIYVFGQSSNAGALINPINGRLAFYSIGEAITLSSLDTRVSALFTAIGAAI